MWTISQLKEEAKISLNRQYWITVLVCLLVGFLISFNLGSINNSIHTNNSSTLEKLDPSDIESFSDFIETFGELIFTSSAEGIIISTALIINIIVYIINICYTIFIANVISVGACIFFLSTRIRETKIESVFFAFNGNYKNVVITVFLKNLYISLWSLLFIIPGIIKTYEYRMTEYILAENPNISHKRALELSSKMMDGEKFNAWVLDLSFIGWHILNMFTCGLLGIFFINPYIRHTNAGLYIALRSKAISNGYTSEEELCCIVNANDLGTKKTL